VTFIYFLHELMKSISFISSLFVLVFNQRKLMTSRGVST